MVNLVADNVGFCDVNLRNLKIDCMRAEATGGRETAAYSLDCLCFVANGSGFATIGNKTWHDLFRGAVIFVKKGETISFINTGEDEFEIYAITVDAYGSDKFFASLGFTSDKRLSSLDGKMTVVEELYKATKTNTLPRRKSLSICNTTSTSTLRALPKRCISTGRISARCSKALRAFRPSNI